MSDPVSVRCLSPFEWRMGWLKGFFVFLGIIGLVIVLRSRSAGFDYSLPLVLAAAAMFLGVYFWPSKATLLEDGIAYKRYGFTKFIPYSKILKTEVVQKLGASTKPKKHEPEKIWTVYCAIRLHLAGGGTVDIGTGSEDLNLALRISPNDLRMGAYGEFGAFNRRGWELRQAIDKRVNAVHGLPEPTAAMTVGLLRGEKTTAEWLASIEAVAPARGDAYRGADGAHEALWRVLEDDQSPREARAGAALALRTHLDEEGRHRMRVVVETCESPKLRVAIETALDDEAGEPRLLEALEEASFPREQ